MQVSAPSPFEEGKAWISRLSTKISDIVAAWRVEENILIKLFMWDTKHGDTTVQQNSERQES